jgi:hypothetical protein
MPEYPQTTPASQELLKALRASRKEAIARVTDRVKKQRSAIKAIKEVLREGARTVPELAEKIDLPAAQIFWYLASLKKYGEVIEGEKSGSYFRYALAAAEEQEGNSQK